MESVNLFSSDSNAVVGHVLYQYLLWCTLVFDFSVISFYFFSETSAKRKVIIDRMIGQYDQIIFGYISHLLEFELLCVGILNV